MSGHNLRVLTSSESPEWYTPAEVLTLVRQLMQWIELDPCSCQDANRSVKARRFYTAGDDGLSQDWKAHTAFLNPPFGRGIGKWVQKLHDNYQAGSVREAVALVPARVDTRWWQTLAEYPVCFWRGRLAFGGPNGAHDAAPFPVALFYLGPNKQRFYQLFSPHGLIYVAMIDNRIVREA